jgi:hypothetical protein
MILLIYLLLITPTPRHERPHPASLATGLGLATTASSIKEAGHLLPQAQA